MSSSKGGFYVTKCRVRREVSYVTVVFEGRLVMLLNVVFEEMLLCYYVSCSKGG